MEKLVINKLNEKENQNIIDLVDKYLDIKTKQANLEMLEKETLDEILELDIHNISILEKNLSFTISKVKETKIDYDLTLSGLDPNDYKKEVISKKWDDNKITAELKDKVVYKEVQSKPRVTISSIVKE